MRIGLAFSTIAVVLAVVGTALAQGVGAAPPPAAGERDVPPVSDPPPVSDLRRLAEQGIPRAQYELGILYVNGDGVATDYAEAARWFGEAARHGDPDAPQQLAFMLALGLRPAAAAPSMQAAGGAFRVQVASVAKEADGPREWRRLQRLHPDALAALKVTLSAVDAADGARLFRVEGGPLDEERAHSVCTKLRAAGAGCRVVKPGAEPEN